MGFSSTPGGRRRSGARIAVVAVAVVTAVALIAAGAWLLVLPSAADKQLVAASTALDGAAASLSGADTTADIRAAGKAAAQPARTAEAFLNGLQEQDRPAELVLVTGALAAIASLADVSGEAPGAWQSATPAIRSAAAAELSTAGLASSLATAADNADAVIAGAVAQFDAWRAENAAAVAARDAAITEATSYQSAMRDAIDDYIALRNSLSDYIELVDTEGSTIDEGYFQLGEAASDRRAVRDDMASITAPRAAAAAHDRLLSVISDGIAGVDSAVRALDVAVCDWGVCYVYDEPAWWNFRDESKRITAALDDAMAAWTSAASQAIADAEAMPLPPKPQV